MSAGNRKNRYRPPVQTDRTGTYINVTVFFAIIALLGAILGTILVR